MLRRIHRVPPAALVPLLAVACSQSDPSDDPGLRGAPLTRCSATEAERWVLTDDRGRGVYVEPSALLPVRPDDPWPGSALLAGAPTYTWTSLGDDEWDRASAHDLVGYFVGGSDVPVARPPDFPRLDRFRIARSGLGRVAVLYERDSVPATVGPGPDTERVVPGFGLLDVDVEPGGGLRVDWRTLEPPDVPSGVRVYLLIGSDLVADGAGGFHRLTVRTGHGRRDVVLFSYVGGRWRETVVQPDFGDDAGLVVGPSGLVGAVAGLDSDYGALLTSVRLFAIHDPTIPPRRVVLGRPGDRFQDPHVLPLPDGSFAVHWTRYPGEAAPRLEAAVVRGWDVPDASTVVDTIAESLWYAAHTPGPGGVWIAAQTVRGEGESSLLEITHIGSDGPERVYSTPNPFTGPMAMTATADGDLLVVGPLANLASPAPSVRSLVIRLEPSCAQATAADHRPGHTTTSHRSHDAHDANPRPSVRRSAGGGL